MKSVEKLRSRIRQIIVRRLVQAFLWDRERQASAVWKWFEVALLVSGLTLAGFYLAGRFDSYLESRAALKQIQSLDSTAIPPDLPPTETGASADEEANGAEPATVKAPIRKPSPQRRAPLGVLEIPSIHLQVPLMEGADAQNLNRGVGRIPGTARPGETGNIGIAGHRDSFFKKLKYVKAGDQVVLRSAAGTDTYVVSQFQIVSPRDVSVLRAKDSPALTLVTCYPFAFIGSAPERFVVTAYLENHEAAGATASDVLPMTQPNTTTQEEQ